MKVSEIAKLTKREMTKEKRNVSFVLIAGSIFCSPSYLANGGRQKETEMEKEHAMRKLP